ncbi:MAG TPA: OmpA family protein [Terriglobia bacterium]|nr:OmpA family protein [Terriglobia bacterium]
MNTLKEKCVGSERLTALGAVILLVFLAPGCATKKYVQTKVFQPLEAKITGVDKKTDANAQRITDVDQKAEAGVSDAQARAETADKDAGKADEHAQEAQNLAQKGVDQATTVAKDLDNIDNYQPVKSETVLFRINHADLTVEDKSTLDELAGNINSMKHFVIEVQGYTDKTGSKEYNLELSRRRADAVVRYLTEVHKIPLAKIHLLGYGEDSPAQPNNTRAGRKENRRVEITVLAPQITSGATTASMPASNSTSASTANQ